VKRMRKETEKYQTDIKVVKEEIIRIDLHAIIATRIILLRAIS
jgi:hypothetical protein